MPLVNLFRLLISLFKPLVENLRVIFKAKPLALSALGIAFFIFMVSYMRATMYMHGQTRVPAWDDFKTSLVVASVALGVGLGAPLAGFLSGGKIELGLVPLACLGMIVSTTVAALLMNNDLALILALVAIGFFSGFYMVPLYTLFQHRAPKASKGDLVATSNFINVTGAIAASVLFYLLVEIGKFAGVTPIIPLDSWEVNGSVFDVKTDDHKKILAVDVLEDDGVHSFEAEKKTILRLPKAGLDVEDVVKISRYRLHGVTYYLFRDAEASPPTVYNNEALPRYLFLGAALMTFGILVLLCRKLPDFFTRSFFWLQSLGKYHLRAVGMKHLPTDGPLILVTNASNLQSSLQLVAVTDRSTTVVLAETEKDGGSLVRSLAKRTTLLTMPTNGSWDQTKAQALETLRVGNLLAVTVDGSNDPRLAQFLDELHRTASAPLVPVFCGPLDAGDAMPRIRVVFGEHFVGSATLDQMRAQIAALREWIQKHDEQAAREDHH